MNHLDEDARYEVRDWPGVAVRIDGYPLKWEAYTYLSEEDEDGNQVELDSDEGEWIDDRECGQVIVVMVGDDKRHTVDVEDLTKIDDLAYCLECGQIGCTHDGRERES
jgi:hypothetical protein